MNTKYLALISRIEEELTNLKQIIKRINKGWEKAKKEGDDLYLDSVALNLHSFYAGIEKIFELIARNIDQTIPEGSSWHQELLQQMKINIKKIRPAVISQKTHDQLEEYRGIRHVVRNVYTFNLSEKRIEPLVRDISGIFEELEKEVKEFIYIIEKKAQE
jgi:hypothetical protein